MKPDNPARHFIVPLLAAVAIYVIAYGGIEYLRNRKGPWEVTFTRAPLPANAGATPAPAPTDFPALLINQPALKLATVQLIF